MPSPSDHADESAIRAVVLGSVLALVRKLPDARTKEVLRRLGEDTQRRVQASGPLAWLPGTDLLAFMDATVLGLGPLSARALWRESFEQVAATPLLKPLVHGALTLFGRSPAGLVSMSPKGWRLVGRNLGSFTHEADPEMTRAVLRLNDYPLLLCQSGTFAQALAGCFEGYFSLTQTSGVVEVCNIDAHRGTAEFHFAWDV